MPRFSMIAVPRLLAIRAGLSRTAWRLFLIELVIDVPVLLALIALYVAVFAPLALGVWGGSKKRIVTAMIAVILAGVFVMILGLTPPEFFLMAVASMFLFSFANAIANSIFMVTMTHLLGTAALMAEPMLS